MTGAVLGKFVERPEVAVHMVRPQQTVFVLTEAVKIGVRSSAPLYSCVTWASDFPKRGGVMMVLGFSTE